MNAGEGLDLFADFRVGGKIAGLDIPATKTLGRLAFGGEILRFRPLVHQPRGFEGDRLPKFAIFHPFVRRYYWPIVRRGAINFLCIDYTMQFERRQCGDFRSNFLSILALASKPPKPRISPA